MDPQACYERMIDAIADDDLPEAFDACRDLQRWFGNGGFNPDGVSRKLIDRMGQLIGDAARFREIQLLTQQEMF